MLRHTPASLSVFIQHKMGRITCMLNVTMSHYHHLKHKCGTADDRILTFLFSVLFFFFLNVEFLRPCWCFWETICVSNNLVDGLVCSSFSKSLNCKKNLNRSRLVPLNSSIHLKNMTNIVKKQGSTCTQVVHGTKSLLNIQQPRDAELFYFTRLKYLWFCSVLHESAKIYWNTMNIRDAKV